MGISAKQRLLARQRTWDWLEPPVDQGPVTILDLLGVTDPGVFATEVAAGARPCGRHGPVTSLPFAREHRSCCERRRPVPGQGAERADPGRVVQTIGNLLVGLPLGPARTTRRGT
jgi:hypothetical protein